MTALSSGKTGSRSVVRTFEDFGVYGDELGPFATFCAQVTFFVALAITFQAVQDFPGLSQMPNIALLAGIGVMFLAPRNAVMKMPFSVSLATFIGLILLSVIWSNNTSATVLELKGRIPVLICVSILVGLLKFEDLTKALIWSMRFALAVTTVAVIIDPDAREHVAQAAFEGENLPGWHGWYAHKNFMAPFFGFGAMTVMMFDRTKWVKWLTVGGLVVMIVMSQSRTGLFAFCMMVAVWLWLQHFSRLDERNGVMFFVSTFGLGLLAIIGAFASISAVTTAAGKDTSFSGRTEIWSATINASMERPLLGYGLNGLYWREPLTPVTADLWRNIGFEASHAHQGFLDIIGDFGLIGLGIFLAVFYSTFSAGWRMMKTNRKVGLWIVSIMAGQLFMALSENVLTGSWLVVLVIFRLVSIRRQGMEFPEQPAKRRSSWALP